MFYFLSLGLFHRRAENMFKNGYVQAGIKQKGVCVLLQDESAKYNGHVELNGNHLQERMGLSYSINRNPDEADAAIKFSLLWNFCGQLQKFGSSARSTEI